MCEVIQIPRVSWPKNHSNGRIHRYSCSAAINRKSYRFVRYETSKFIKKNNPAKTFVFSMGLMYLLCQRDLKYLARNIQIRIPRTWLYIFVKEYCFFLNKQDFSGNSLIIVINHMLKNHVVFWKILFYIIKLILCYII